MAEEKKVEKIEKVYIINLSRAYEVPRQKRAKRAIKILREQLARHLKLEKDKIKISNALNSAIFSNSMKKPIKKVKVKAVIDQKGAIAYLFDEKGIKQRKPPKQINKTKKEKEKKQEKEAAKEQKATEEKSNKKEKEK